MHRTGRILVCTNVKIYVSVLWPAERVNGGLFPYGILEHVQQACLIVPTKLDDLNKISTTK